MSSIIKIVLFCATVSVIPMRLTARSADTHGIESLATSSIRDFQATVNVVKADQQELRKINRDFGMTYRLKEITLTYKDPDKLRMEGRLGLVIVNGSTRLFKVPQIGLTKRDDLGTSPGKRYSLIEIGLVSRSAIEATDATHVRDEMVNSSQAHVFKVAYKGDETSHSLVWIDPRNRTILKREWYDSSGKLKATFVFQDPKEIQPGIWIPTRMEVRNADGVVAGVTTCDDVKINQNVPDSLFETAG